MALRCAAVDVAGVAAVCRVKCRQSRLTLVSFHADALHPWVVWLYYLNPLTYAFRAVVVSEFSATRWDQPSPSIPSVSAGTAVLQSNGLDLPKLWMGASVAILIGYIIVINIVVVISLKLLNGKALGN